MRLLNILTAHGEGYTPADYRTAGIATIVLITLAIIAGI